MIRNDMELTHKPFSATLFALPPDDREVVIEPMPLTDNEDSVMLYSSEDEEARPLLGK